MQLEKLPSIIDRGSRSDRPRVTTPTRAGLSPPVLLVLAAPRHTLRRASSQSVTSQWKPTTTVINQYSQDAAVDTCVAHTFLHYSLTLTCNLDFQTPASYELDPYTCEIKAVQTYERTRPVASPSSLTRSIIAGESVRKVYSS